MKEFSSLFGSGVMLAGLMCVTTACNSPRGGALTEGQLVDDRKLTRSVESRLANDPVYKYQGLDVRTYNGVVQLSGFVDAEAQQQRAERLAREIPGVQNVENAIMVKRQTLPEGERLDYQLREVKDLPYPEARGTNAAPTQNEEPDDDDDVDDNR